MDYSWFSSSLLALVTMATHLKLPHPYPSPFSPSASLEQTESCLCGFYLDDSMQCTSPNAELLQVLQTTRLWILPSAGSKVNGLYDLLLALISAHSLSCVPTTEQFSSQAHQSHWQACC